jgi:hypothetical protein
MTLAAACEFATLICPQGSTRFPQLAHVFFTMRDQEKAHEVIWRKQG